MSYGLFLESIISCLSPDNISEALWHGLGTVLLYHSDEHV